MHAPNQFDNRDSFHEQRSLPITVDSRPSAHTSVNRCQSRTLIHRHLTSITSIRQWMTMEDNDTEDPYNGRDKIRPQSLPSPAAISSQRRKQIPNLPVNLARVVHRPSDLLAQHLPIPLPQPMDRHRDRAGGHAETF